MKNGVNAEIYYDLIVLWFQLNETVEMHNNELERRKKTWKTNYQSFLKNCPQMSL